MYVLFGMDCVCVCVWGEMGARMMLLFRCYEATHTCWQR